jgi:hypothetical protein
MRQILLLAVALALVGCGGTEDGPSDWESRSSPAWSLFENAYERGWTKGCEAANDFVIDAIPDAETQLTLPACTPAAPVGNSVDVPLAEPVDPEQSGYDLGFTEGCSTAMSLNDWPVGEICFSLTDG